MSKATLTLETGEKLELNMQKGTLGYQTIDIQPFLKHKLYLLMIPDWFRPLYADPISLMLMAMKGFYSIEATRLTN